MNLNGTQLVDRHNRASVGSKVAIKTIFLNNGAYIDPYDVSACTIFPKTANMTPASVIDANNGILKGASGTSATVNMSFGISGDPVGALPHDGTLSTRVTSNNLDWVSPTLYIPATDASGIYRTGVGEYVCVLDGTLDLSGSYQLEETYNEGLEIINTASSLGAYIDVWTVKLFETSEYQVFINEFRMFNDVFTSITEPLLLSPANKLIRTKYPLGSIMDMVISTDMTVGNRELTDETKNIIRDYSLVDAQVKVEKVNENSPNLPARTEITDFTTTNVRTTSDNTIVYTLDTTTLAGILNTADVGGPSGSYILTVKYSFLGQTFITTPFYFLVI